MHSKLSGLWKRYRDVILYVLFGAVTTAVNFLVYYPLYNLLHMSALISSVVAWIVCVAVAFVTNKHYVFRHVDWSCGVLLSELTKFFVSRIGSGLAEAILLYITVDMLLWNGNILKLLVAILVVILNYISSKFIVFR